MTNQTLVEAKLQRSLTASEVATLSVLIAVAERFITSHTNRNFVDSEGAATIKYYDGNGQRELTIDDATEVTKVEIFDASNDTSEEVDSSDYTHNPYNSLPITSIRQLYGAFPHGVQNIAVTATWGSAEGIPDDIQGIATHIVAELISNPSQVKQESIEGYSRVLYDLLPPIYQAALDSRIKIMI